MERMIMETDKEQDGLLAAAALSAMRQETRHAAGIDPMLLAAWLEGRLDEASEATVEGMLAADPALFDALLAARDAGQAAVTVREIETACALVRLPWWRRIIPNVQATQGRWGAAVAATVLVASVGMGAFELGEAFAGINAMQQSAAMRSMLSDDLFDMMEGK
jgi:hypothetical protein